MDLKILVVGAGSIGQRHHGNVQALGAQSTLRGWRNYGYEALRAEIDQYDAMVLATATDLRLGLIEIATAAGKPIYIEKPLAVTPEEVDAIAEITQGQQERSMLGYMMRYHPALRALARKDRSDVFQFSLSIGHDVTQWRQNWRFSESYAARNPGGGVLLDLCHELDMAYCLFGDLTPTSVECMGHTAYPGIDMSSRISLRGANISGEVAMDYLTPQLHRRAILRGVNGLYDFDFAAQRYQVQTHAGCDLETHPLERNAMFLDAMRDFLALVGGQPVSDVEHLPRLDLALPSARLAAKAWAMRNFIGTIEKEIP